MITVLTPLKWGVTWAATHPWETIGGYLLLKNPSTRGWALRMMQLGATGLVTGARGAAIITFEELLVPAALSTPVQTAGIIAAPVVVAAVGAAGVTAAQHKVGLIGPKAIKIPSPIISLSNVEFNPFFMGWGSVV